MMTKQTRLNAVNAIQGDWQFAELFDYLWDFAQRGKVAIAILLLALRCFDGISNMKRHLGVLGSALLLRCKPTCAGEQGIDTHFPPAVFFTLA
jgi:hypothetical protein